MTAPTPDTLCVCGHTLDEHRHDPKFPGSTSCAEDDCDCIAFEAAEDDEWDGDEDRP
jgi:hypothetical protein